MFLDGEENCRSDIAEDHLWRVSTYCVRKKGDKRLWIKAKTWQHSHQELWSYNRSLNDVSAKLFTDSNLHWVCENYSTSFVSSVPCLTCLLLYFCRTEVATAAFRFGHSLIRQTFSADNTPLDLSTIFNVVNTVATHGELI